MSSLVEAYETQYAQYYPPIVPGYAPLYGLEDNPEYRNAIVRIKSLSSALRYALQTGKYDSLVRRFKRDLEEAKQRYRCFAMCRAEIMHDNAWFQPPKGIADTRQWYCEKLPERLEAWKMVRILAAPRIEEDINAACNGKINYKHHPYLKK